MTRLRISSASGPIAEITEDGSVFVWWATSRRDPDLDRVINDAVFASPGTVQAGRLIETYARQRREWTVEAVR